MGESLIPRGALFLRSDNGGESAVTMIAGDRSRQRAGNATDELRIWFVEGRGLIRSQSLREGVINEMTSFSP